MLVTRSILNELSFVTLASHVRNSELGGRKDVEETVTERVTDWPLFLIHKQGNDFS